MIQGLQGQELDNITAVVLFVLVLVLILILKTTVGLFEDKHIFPNPGC